MCSSESGDVGSPREFMSQLIHVLETIYLPLGKSSHQYYITRPSIRQVTSDVCSRLYEYISPFGMTIPGRVSPKSVYNIDYVTVEHDSRTFYREQRCGDLSLGL